MAYRQNFNAMQRQSAFTENADWLSKHRVTGVMIALSNRFIDYNRTT